MANSIFVDPVSGSSSGGGSTIFTGGVIAPWFGSEGAIPVTGFLRMANNMFITTLQSNASTVDLLGYTSSNSLILGDAAAGVVDYRGASHRFRISGTAVWDIDASGNIVDDGTHTITAGSRVISPAYTVGATPGASGTGTVISQITVVNGIVTAITVA